MELNSYLQENTLNVAEVGFFLKFSYLQIPTSRASPVALMNAFIFLDILWKLLHDLRLKG